MDSKKLSQALSSVLEFIEGDTSDTTLLDREYKVLANDPIHQEALRTASVRLLMRIQKPEREQISSPTLYEELVTSFKAQGLSDEVAHRNTYRVLGVLATGGANTPHRMSRFTQDASLVGALTALTSVMVILDMIRDQKGLPLFSYPKEVQTTLDTGKTYHFWMTAYLTHRLVEEGYDPEVAKTAARISQQGYQMFSTTAFRHPAEAFERENWSSFNNRIRVDLAFASAGAEWAAREAKVFRKTASEQEVAAFTANAVSIDERLMRILRESESVEKISNVHVETMLSTPEGKIQYALLWRRLFAPDAAWEIEKEKSLKTRALDTAENFLGAVMNLKASPPKRTTP